MAVKAVLLYDSPLGCRNSNNIEVTSRSPQGRQGVPHRATTRISDPGNEFGEHGDIRSLRPSGGIGRRRGLKIPRGVIPVPVRVRSRLLFYGRLNEICATKAGSMGPIGACPNCLVAVSRRIARPLLRAMLLCFRAPAFLDLTALCSSWNPSDSLSLPRVSR